MSQNNQTLRFLRRLIKNGSAQYERTNDRYEIDAPKRISLPADKVKALVSQGIVQERGCTLLPLPQTITWIKRHLTQTETPFAEQHQQAAHCVDGARINLAENPLSRLATGKRQFLLPHHLLAGERFHRLFQRAALRTRTTMSYQAEPVSRKTQGARSGADLSDVSIDARRQIDAIYTYLPAECTGVIIDVCGFEKGLQQIEAERGWPRRSAKLVLRIGLEQLAAHFGLMPEAVGEANNYSNAWRDTDARPMVLEMGERI